MTERSRERNRGRPRRAPREDDEEAVARAMRARIEAAADQGDEGDDENRERLGTWRLAKAGFPLLLLMLATVSGVKSCLESSDTDAQRELLNEVAARNNARLETYTRGNMSADEEAQKRKRAEDSGGELAFDEASKNLTSGPAKEDWEPVKDEALVTYDHCGRSGIGARESAALGHLLASEDSMRAIGRCISISPSELAAFRTNEAQAGARDRNTVLWGLWETGAAAKATRGLHELGLAFDMGEYWWLKWPFMKAHGFQCGPDNGILSHWDLGHCQRTIRPEPSEATKEKIWKKRCGQKPGLCPPDWRTHRWQGTIQEAVDFMESQKRATQEREQRKLSREKRKRRR